MASFKDIFLFIKSFIEEDHKREISHTILNCIKNLNETLVELDKNFTELRIKLEYNKTVWFSFFHDLKTYYFLFI